MIRASGVSGITELVIDFDGNLHRTITDTDILAPLNTGDDVDFEITVPLSSITYTATTEVEILLEGGTSADIELEVATLGDLLGSGRTIEDADLVVTPSRVESAIHNMDVNAIADVRDAINSPDTFLELNDVSETTYSGQGGMAVVVNDTGTGLEYGEGGDTSSLAAVGYTYTIGRTTEDERTLILTRDSNDVVYGTYIERADGTVDFMVSGQFIAGGG